MHAKAIPLLLTNEDEYEAWLTAPAEQALELQRLPDEEMLVVAKGARSDCGEEELLLL